MAVRKIGQRVIRSELRKRTSEDAIGCTWLIMDNFREWIKCCMAAAPCIKSEIMDTYICIYMKKSNHLCRKCVQ